MMKTDLQLTIPVVRQEPQRGDGKKRLQRTGIPIKKRSFSLSPLARRPKTKEDPKKEDRRCQSWSAATHVRRPSVEQFVTSGPDGIDPQTLQMITDFEEKVQALPHCLIAKISRTLTTKKREFFKMRKSLIKQQNVFLESYAQLMDIESHTGTVSVPDEALGEARVVSVTGWPAHDLLLIIRDDIDLSNKEVGGVCGSNIMQQLSAQLEPIPDNMMLICKTLLARRNDVLTVLKNKPHRSERSVSKSNLELRTKNMELEEESENLQKMVNGTIQNLKAKVEHTLQLAKIPWVDRDTLTKKLDRLQRENMVLQYKLDKFVKKPSDTQDYDQPPAPTYQAISEELSKERAAREALREVVESAESMLRVARARISTLERQINQSRAELEAAKKKHKDLEQLYRQRESSFDARSKKLQEISKTGEMTIDTLSRQRDALEIRVKELRDQTEIMARSLEARDAEQRAQVELLEAKIAEQVMLKSSQDCLVAELELKVKQLEDNLKSLRERSLKLVDMERKRCLDSVPPKENEPSDRETEIWKELQTTRSSLSRVEAELTQCRADKDSFLNSLSQIARGDTTNTVQENIATELLHREKTIVKLQHEIETLRENEKLMEERMTQYENKVATLRLEVLRLRNYDCYVKEVSSQDLQSEIVELHMQVEKLSRERSALATAAASRALMLERHERSAELFASTLHARRDLCALLEAPFTQPVINHTEVARSLSVVCAGAANTWTALRAERARVLRLESAVWSQGLQLQRVGQARTQLERRRAMLEREVLRIYHAATSDHSVLANKNPSLVLTFKESDTSMCQPKTELKL